LEVCSFDIDFLKNSTHYGWNSAFMISSFSRKRKPYLLLSWSNFADFFSCQVPARAVLEEIYSPEKILLPYQTVHLQAVEGRTGLAK